MTIPTTITDSDMIVLQSVESFIESKKIPMTNPEERILIYQEARDYLYSDIPFTIDAPIVQYKETN